MGGLVFKERLGKPCYDARDEWIARTSDDQIITNILACKLALVTRAHDFLTTTDSAVFLRGARAFTLQHPPVQQVEDVTRIEDLSDLSDADLAACGLSAMKRARRMGLRPRHDLSNSNKLADAWRQRSATAYRESRPTYLD